MDSQRVLEAPKPQPTVVAKVSKVSNIVKISRETNKKSTKLRKIFEKGIYQRKTQLSVLNRYKKRIDGINKEKDKRYQKNIGKKPKKSELKIPKFKGKFFSGKGDPLLGISALAAMNAYDKLRDGDLLGALGPGIMAAATLMAQEYLVLHQEQLVVY